MIIVKYLNFAGLPSAQISYIPAAVGLQTPTLTPAGDQRYFEYPLTPQPMPTNAGQLHRDSLLQRSKHHFRLEKQISSYSSRCKWT